LLRSPDRDAAETASTTHTNTSSAREPGAASSSSNFDNLQAESPLPASALHRTPNRLLKQVPIPLARRASAPCPQATPQTRTNLGTTDNNSADHPSTSAALNLNQNSNSNVKNIRRSSLPPPTNNPKHLKNLNPAKPDPDRSRTSADKTIAAELASTIRSCSSSSSTSSISSSSSSSSSTRQKVDDVDLSERRVADALSDPSPHPHQETAGGKPREKNKAHSCLSHSHSSTRGISNSNKASRTRFDPALARRVVPTPTY
jgi:hypothetical protein